MAARCSMRAGHRGAGGGWEIGAPETSSARQELPNEVRASREPGSVKILRLLSLQHDAHGEPPPAREERLPARLSRGIARPAGACAARNTICSSACSLTGPADAWMR